MRPTLPLIPGVRPLSRIEIKKDISDIDCYGLSDAESTVSVLSDDVLNSSYPVKPRRYPKTKQLPELQRTKTIQKEPDVDQSGIEETIEFLRVIETAKPEIYEAEREREDLEIKYQALRELCSNAEDAFRKKKSFFENYLRLLQFSTRNSYHLQDSLSLHNSLLYDLLISLKSRRKTFSHIGLQYQDSFTHSEDSGGSVPIFFYVSQVIQTPDGLGTIVSVDKQKQIVSVYLPELNQTTKEYSTSTLYNFLIGNSLMSADVYQKQNLERKWNYQSLLNEIPLDIVTPFHQNIQNLTDEDIYTLIQPTSAQSLDHSSSNCKKAKKSKTNSTEDNLQTISTAPQMPRLSIPLITKAENPLMNQQAAILFMKPGTLPFFVESMSHDNEMKHSNSSLSLELLSQINSSSLYKHHLLPNPYDDSFFESLGFEPDSCSKFLSVNSSNEEELTKMHEVLRPLLDKIRISREETKFSALQVERSKMSFIQQFRELSSLRLGLFTHRILMKSQANGLNSENIVSQSQELKSLKADQTTNTKSSSSSNKKKSKSPHTVAPQPVAPVVESLANSRPKRKKEESQIEQVDLDDDEIYSQSLATTSSKSKKQRK